MIQCANTGLRGCVFFYIILTSNKRPVIMWGCDLKLIRHSCRTRCLRFRGIKITDACKTEPRWLLLGWYLRLKGLTRLKTGQHSDFESHFIWGGLTQAFFVHPRKKLKDTETQEIGNSRKQLKTQAKIFVFWHFWTKILKIHFENLHS